VLIRCVGFFDLVFVFVITQVTQLVALAIAVIAIEQQLESRKG